MSMFFVDEGNSSLIDDWVSGTKTAEESKTKIQSSSSATAQQRGGLGFKEPAKAIVSKSDQILKSKLQNKRKHEDNHAQLYNRGSAALHGIVEDAEESRTSIVSKKTKIASTVSPAPAKEKTIPSAGTAVAASSKKGDNLAAATTEGIVANGVKQTQQNKQQQLPKKSSGGDTSSSSSSKNNQDSSINPYTLDTEGAALTKDHFTVVARKRGKTRSKQKNIRRDNRADASKPAYLLDAKSKEYKGRPLTKETTAILINKPGGGAKSSNGSVRTDNRQAAAGLLGQKKIF